MWGSVFFYCLTSNVANASKRGQRLLADYAEQEHFRASVSLVKRLTDPSATSWHLPCARKRWQFRPPFRLLAQSPPLSLFIAENIKKGDTLQTAAFQPHGGISLYRDILANVLSTDKDTTSIPENQTDNQEVAENVVVDENVTPEEKEGGVR